ncbi:siphovirus Gp157 family protein [Ligilactobacillus equi]|uniref:siphovirus Gp157 family protein n=1 Tax=Ligilactobacillus equi TaxID=137357 RepID=UPI002ED37792
MKATEIVNAIEELLDRDDLDPKTLTDTFDSLHGELKDKLDSMVWTVNHIDDQLAPLKNQLERRDKLAKAIKTLENRQRSIKEYIRYIVDLSGGEVITDEHVIKSRKAGGQQLNRATLDESKIPAEFFEEQKPKLNTTKLKKALIAGEKIDGADLYQPRSVNIQ